MLELTMSVELGSPAETVWGVVGNFNGLPDWHPWVKASELNPLPGGVGRRVVIEGGAGGGRELHERLYRMTTCGASTPARSLVGRRLAVTTSGASGFRQKVRS